MQMMTSAAPAASGSPGQFSDRLWLHRWPIVVLVIGLAVYGIFLANFEGAYAGGSDSSGYLECAHLLSAGRVRTEYREIPGLPAANLPEYTYVPLGFKPSASKSEMVPTYPIGLPLIIAAIASVSGWEMAPHIALWLHAMAGVVLMFLLVRLSGLAPGWAVLGAMLLALCPLYLTYAVQLMSDLPATTWAMATVLTAWLARSRRGWAPVAGVAFGVAVLVRPTNIVLIAPVAIALGIDWRRWLAFGLGGLPLAVVQALFNQAAYGHPLASGYGQVDGLFQWENFSVTLAHYAVWLPLLLTPFGFLAFGLPWVARRAPRWSALLAAWAIAVLGIYAFYYHTHETWWYLRFVMPAFPAVWLAALLVAQSLAERWGLAGAAAGWRGWSAGLALGLILAGFLWRWDYRNKPHYAGRGERAYQIAIQAMLPVLPPDAVIAAMQASGAIYCYSDYTIVRGDQIRPDTLPRIADACAAARRPLYALLQFEEQRDYPEHRLLGAWEKIWTVRDFTLWRYTAAVPASLARPTAPAS
jgi:hypothetical protein